MANGNGKKGNGKKGNGNGKKTTKPIKPPKQRRGKTEQAIKKNTKKLEPIDAKLGRKIITQPSFRKKVGNAFLRGLTFGFYKP